MQALLGNSSVPVYLKLQASLILSVTYIAALIYAGLFAAAHGWNLDGLPSMVSLVLGTGLAVALNVLNIHLGASTDHAAAAAATAAPAPAAQTVAIPVSVVAAPAPMQPISAAPAQPSSGG